jgi:hypothetical protein
MVKKFLVSKAYILKHYDMAMNLAQESVFTPVYYLSLAPFTNYEGIEALLYPRMPCK